MTWLKEYLANNDPQPARRAADAREAARLIAENAPAPEAPCAWCGEVRWIDDCMSGCCSAECLRHHNGDHTG